MLLSAAKWVLAALMFSAVSVAAEKPCTPLKPGEVPGGSYVVKDDVKAPIPVLTPDPEYPSAARTAGVQGTVRLLVFLDCTGTPGTVKLHAPDLNGQKAVKDQLGKTALDAVRHWKFRPATLRGEPVMVRFDVEFTFKLEDPIAAAPKGGSVTHSLIYVTLTTPAATASK